MISPRLIFGGVVSLIMAILVGLFVWEKHEASKWHSALIAQQSAYKIAQADAQAALQHVHDAAEAEYKTKAEKADHDYQVSLAASSAATTGYIATHRVQQPGAQSTSGAAAPATQGGSTAVPEGVPAGSVVVSQDDVRACNGATTYGLNAHNWAVGLGQ